MFYVYEWYVVNTEEVIYVGKGCGNRYKVRKHNRLFNEMIKRFDCRSRIVEEFENEKDAFNYEFERIFELKLKGQCVCNINVGGSGGTTDWWTEDMRQHYSDKNIMKSRIMRKRMSENNPMKNKEVSEKVNSKKRKRVVIGETEYASIKVAMKEFNVSRSVVIEWCRRGVTSFGVSCHFKDLSIEPYTYKNNGKKRAVIYMGKYYESSSELARQINVSQSTTSRWCRNGVDSYGNQCRYEDDDRSGNIIIGQKNIPVIINGQWYKSKNEASKILGISSYTITQYLNGNKKDEKYKCEYGNQQPSQGKSDNSTLEGSTTNE